MNAALETRLEDVAKSYSQSLKFVSLVLEEHNEERSCTVNYKDEVFTITGKNSAEKYLKTIDYLKDSLVMVYAISSPTQYTHAQHDNMCKYFLGEYYDDVSKMDKAQFTKNKKNAEPQRSL
jgi:hypothetical protein